MNSSKFDTIVKARAQQRIEQRVARFRQSVADAFEELLKDIRSKGQPFAHPHASRGEKTATFLRESVAMGIFKGLVHKQGEEFPRMTLPAEFWTHEEAEVSKALLSIMDEMQKALCAPVNADPQAIPAETEQPPTA